MTVCIAAQCLYEGRPCFVLCTDGRLEDEYSGGDDLALKMSIGRHNWCYLTAGNTARAQELLSVLEMDAATNVETESEALDAFRVAPRIMKLRLVEEYLNTHWAISLKEFRETGADHFPAETYARIHSEIEGLPIGCEIVVAGFAHRTPVICMMNQNGEVTPHTGFVTAGSGYLLAQAAMFQRKYRWTFGLQHALYCVYEAKKVAENAPGVGKATNLAIWGPLQDIGENLYNAPITFVSAGGFDRLETMRTEFGPKSLEGTPGLDLRGALGWPNLGKQ